VTRYTYLVLVVVSGNCLLAQDFPRQDIDPIRLVDEIFANQTSDLNYADLYENYLQILSNPFDLNTVTAEQLNSLYLLTASQLQAFINYRAIVGKLASVYELQTIPEFTKEVFLKLIPFVAVVDEKKSIDRSLWKRVASEENNYLVLRFSQTIEKQKGYLTGTNVSSRYLGGPQDLYARFRVSRPGDFSIGATVKKDAGEIIDWNPSKKYYGFDYLSFHAQLQNKGKMKNLIVGDYQAQFGQGIMLGSAFGIGKNGETITAIRRSNLGFLPYTSQYQAGYFRGAAIAYQLHKYITVHGMYSARLRDGNLQQDSSQTNISSFSFSGLNRTKSEIENRDAFHEQNMAVIVNFQKEKLDAGVMIHHTTLNAPLQRTPNLYNQFYFNGNENTNVGVFANYTFASVTLFSELAHTLNYGTASCVGMLANLTPQLDVSLHYRKFDRNFYSFYSNALAENSSAQNEAGFYWGWKYTFNKKYSLSGYVDLFEFPWLKYRSYSPSTGSEWLLRFNYKPTKSIYFFVQVKEETKQRNSSADTNLYFAEQGTRRNFWVNLDYAASPTLSFKSRVQFNNYQFMGNETHGSAIMQDISFTQNRFSVSSRYAIFDTDDFDNRIYVYEPDAWLVFSFPAYNGKGVRSLILLQYKINKKIDVWLRWAQTTYSDRTSIGSGGETIAGNTQNDVRFQTRIRF
jgi:hypothetical protein